METAFVVGIVLVAAGWLVMRTVKSYRVALHRDPRCGGSCGRGSDSRSPRLVPTRALARWSRRGQPAQPPADSADDTRSGTESI